MATCFSAIERIQKLAKASAIRNNVETVKISDGVLLRYFSSSTSKVEHTLICVNK
ncbi:PHIKZ232.2 [Pseudomonas phage phiKZ]|uniref:PHIKZ232.2 n=6 Tax=Phikzvirus TaxID=680115 RepID=L7T167_BPDPK|nr:PHIKZ232.2 [Pseudomonas phage phiKZ]AGC26350.1 PHIKZ232.2 [Pseudomonas phage phiKZ]